MKLITLYSKELQHVGLVCAFAFLGETFRQLSSVRPNAVSSCTVMKVFGCTAREDEGLKKFC